MKTILYYTKETLRYVSITILILLCLPALVIGLNELFKENILYPSLFWIAVIVCIAIYGNETQNKQDAQNDKNIKEKGLISLISTKGKTPKEVHEELQKNREKYEEAKLQS